MALVLVVTLVSPSVILSTVRQPEVAESYAYSESFYDSYEEIRAHLQELTGELGVEIASHADQIKSPTDASNIRNLTFNAPRSNTAYPF